MHVRPFSKFKLNARLALRNQADLVEESVHTHTHQADLVEESPRQECVSVQTPQQDLYTHTERERERDEDKPQ